MLISVEIAEKVRAKRGETGFNKKPDGLSAWNC